MTFPAFLFWQSMEKVHIWIALRQEEKKERLETEAEIRRMREQLLQQAKQNDGLVCGFSLTKPTFPKVRSDIAKHINWKWGSCQ